MDRERRVERTGRAVAVVVAVGVFALVGWFALSSDAPTEVTVRLLVLCAVATAVCVLSVRRRARRLDRLAAYLQQG